jgi:hypothetical protein
MKVQSSNDGNKILKNLYNRDDNCDFDDGHYNRALIHKHLLEKDIQDPYIHQMNI